MFWHDIAIFVHAKHVVSASKNVNEGINESKKCISVYCQTSGLFFNYDINLWKQFLDTSAVTCFGLNVTMAMDAIAVGYSVTWSMTIQTWTNLFSLKEFGICEELKRLWRARGYFLLWIWLCWGRKWIWILIGLFRGVLCT